MNEVDMIMNFHTLYKSRSVFNTNIKTKQKNTSTTSILLQIKLLEPIQKKKKKKSKTYFPPADL